jgi:hypothetical protein
LACSQPVLSSEKALAHRQDLLTADPLVSHDSSIHKPDHCETAAKNWLAEADLAVPSSQLKPDPRDFQAPKIVLIGFFFDRKKNKIGFFSRTIFLFPTFFSISIRAVCCRRAESLYPYEHPV